jgi:hypothetical protein
MAAKPARVKPKIHGSGPTSLPWYLALVPAAGAFALYLYTALPEPGWVDSGELALVAHTLGICHPTGSPLYVMWARVFTLLIPGNFFPLTFLSALATALGVGVVACTPLAQRRQSGALSCTAGSLSAASALALAPSIWSQATLNEVYALQFLLFALFLHLWTRRDLGSGRLALPYLAGLAFANHQSAVFLAPFLIERVWPARRRIREWLVFVALGLAGASVYLYLPVRSAAQPLWDWGGTHRLDGFLRHITGWQYSSWVGAGLVELRKGLLQLGEFTWADFGGAFLGLMLLGLFLLWRLQPRTFWVTGISAILCIAFGLNFSNPDVEAFYLLAFVLMALWAGFGVDAFWHRGKGWRYFVGPAVAVALLVQAVIHFPGQNHRRFHVPADWVRDALETVEPGSVVLTREWDHYSPWLYLRLVTDLRPDVTWIDTELLRRSWYPEFIRQIDPERYEAARPALERLAPEIARFEAGLPYDPAAIEGTYADAIYALSLGQSGPVYVDGVAGQPAGWGVERTYLQGAREVPWGLFVRAVRPGEVTGPIPPWPNYRNAGVTAGRDARAEFNLRLYDRARAARNAWGP